VKVRGQGITSNPACHCPENTGSKKRLKMTTEFTRGELSMRPEESFGGRMSRAGPAALGASLKEYYEGKKGWVQGGNRPQGGREEK